MNDNVFMQDTRMLQAILDKISSVESKVQLGFKGVNERFDKTDKRIDKLGLQIANLEDDAPTVEEFGCLKKRVDKLERHFVSA